MASDSESGSILTRHSSLPSPHSTPCQSTPNALKTRMKCRMQCTRRSKLDPQLFWQAFPVGCLVFQGVQPPILRWFQGLLSVFGCVFCCVLYC